MITADVEGVKIAVPYRIESIGLGFSVLQVTPLIRAELVGKLDLPNASNDAKI